MLVALFSAKGSPGVTATALGLAAVWPVPVVLVEADPAGGDLAYRCQGGGGGPVPAGRGLLTLAAAVRGGGPATGAAVTAEAQMLGCGVQLVQGVSTAAQARGLAGLWPSIGQACTTAEVDVVVDLGRLDRSSPVMPLAEAADVVVPVAAATLESVMHLAEGLHDVMGGLAQSGPLRVRPALVGPEGRAGPDCADLDDLFARSGLPVELSVPVSLDAKGVARLEQGVGAAGRGGKSLWLRSVRGLAEQVVGDRLVGVGSP